MNINYKINNFILKRALINIALFIFMTNLMYCSIISDIQSKCIWVSKDNLLDTVKIDSVFNFSIRNDIEKIFFQVRSNGYALYESNLVPKNEELDSLFDPLNYIIRKTINTDIEIHAWFQTYLLVSSSSISPNEQHYYYDLCPDCFEEDINGKSDRDIKLNQIQSKEWEGIFLSPIHPQVNPYLLTVINEIIKKYNIDGIHLDYVRYQDNFYGFNIIGIQDFINLNGIDPRDINRGLISTRYGYSEDYVDSVIYKWDSFRINKISELVRSIKYSILSDSTSIQLSASVKPNYFDAKFRWYQDWMSWVNEDIIDFVVVKNFSSNLNEFNVCNKMITNKLSDWEQKNKIYIGITIDETSTSISNKILLSRLQGYENFSIFEYVIEKDSLNLYNPVMNVLHFNIE